MTAIRSTLRRLHALAGPFAPFAIEAALNTPVAQFEIWLGEAVEAGVAEPHAMTLSTIDVDGNPDARVLLLKDLDEDGWHFAASLECCTGCP